MRERKRRKKTKHFAWRQAYVNAVCTSDFPKHTHAHMNMYAKLNVRTRYFSHCRHRHSVQVPGRVHTPKVCTTLNNSPAIKCQIYRNLSKVEMCTHNLVLIYIPVCIYIYIHGSFGSNDVENERFYMFMLMVFYKRIYTHDSPSGTRGESTINISR